jgi:uncharacterized protein YqgC (DUF456 family)
MPTWLEASLFAATLFFMLIGLLGLFVPAFPGLAIIWLSALIYAILSGGFDWVAGILFVLISILWLVGSFGDNLLMGAGARKGGAAWFSIILGGIAGLLGTILFPPFGGLVAAPLIVLLLEYLRKRDFNQAFLAVRGLAIGWGLTFFLRFGVGVLMICLWLIWAWQSR